MRWICITVLALFACLVAWLVINMLSQGGTISIPATDAYVNYRIDDYNLKCIQVDRQDKIGYYRDEPFCRYIAYYQIKGEDSASFIVANIDANPLNTVPSLVVMQSESNQIHVLQDWTISNIQLYTLGEIKDASELHWNNNAEILYTSQESDIIHHFKETVTSNEQHTFPPITQDPNFYVSSFEALDGKSLYIRALFEESNSIAWVATIVQIEGSFYIQKNFPSEDNFLNLERPSPYEFSTKYTLIEPNTPLYDIIMSIL